MPNPMTTPLIEACARAMVRRFADEAKLTPVAAQLFEDSNWQEYAADVRAVIPVALLHAANICGTLAETTYDDADGFAAATGCEAAIVGEMARMEKQS